MKHPVVRGTIDRRILANYRIDPNVLKNSLPPPFRPQLVNGYAIGGICLIRLKSIRPHFIPFRWGIASENAAHRFAVEWDDHGKTHQGVYIPRRDTSSRINTLVGGRIFPGVHHHASFVVQESLDTLFVKMTSDDGATRIAIGGTVAETFPDDSAFDSLSDASEFFKTGSLGYSSRNTAGEFEGLELRCRAWKVEPLSVEQIESSYFDDVSRFPIGSTQFDCALLMRSIEHEWHGHEKLCDSTSH